MLYICIPVYNEAQTVGLVLWSIRKAFQDSSREYEIFVFNDGSTDATAETLRGYETVLPLTILESRERRGYAAALTELFRAASQRTRYARRDAVITMQGDLTDSPDQLHEFLKRFEGGADIVIGESDVAPAATPPPVRRLRRFASLAMRAAVSIPGVKDPFGSYRLYRVSVIRDALKAAGDGPLARGSSWSVNVDLLFALLPFSRRTETIALAQRYDLRPRQTRVRPFADAWSLLRLGRAEKGRWTSAVQARDT